MFKQSSHKTVEIYTFTDEHHKIWTVEFEDNKFQRTSYDLKSPYSRADWAQLAEFAEIIENLCMSKETPYIPDNVMNEPTGREAFVQKTDEVMKNIETHPPGQYSDSAEEEEQWQQLEAKNGIRHEGNA